MSNNYGIFINGSFIERDDKLLVKNKYSGETFATVSKASKEDVLKAIEVSHKTFKDFSKTPAYKRANILEKTSSLIIENTKLLSETLASEAGKALKFAKGEVIRAAETFKFASEEAKRISGETIPLDASSSGEKRKGYYQRYPIGVIGAITPFNFPLNLVAHKVAPAIAAGNTIVLKPASSTPVSSLILANLLTQAGLPNGVLNVVIGNGSTVGDIIVEHPLVRKITFTGSAEVGENITRKAGIKKVTLELGNNSAVIVDESADLQKAVKACTLAAFANSGQVCISLQRLLVHEKVYDSFLDEFIKSTKSLKVGDPLLDDTDVGPMIDIKEAERAENWIKEAVDKGAKILVGGKREEAILHPTILSGVNDSMRLCREEIFAPVVSVFKYSNFNEAVEQANNTDYGLQAGVFTKDLEKAFYAIDNIDVGGVMINDSSMYRVDHMPYGGNKKSGLGREGVKYAIDEMTNIRMVVFNLS